MQKRYTLKKLYGLSLDKFDDMLIRQDNKCAICDKILDTKWESVETKAYVDHDHRTGTVRAVVCRNCNLMIGYANDSIELLTKAISYLTRWQT